MQINGDFFRNPHKIAEKGQRDGIKCRANRRRKKIPHSTESEGEIFRDVEMSIRQDFEGMPDGIRRKEQTLLLSRRHDYFTSSKSTSSAVGLPPLLLPALVSVVGPC